MAIKYYKNGEWKIFPGTLGAPGKGAYEIAVENGYSGTREEFEEQIKLIINFSDELQENAEAIQELQKQIDNLKNNGVDLSDYYTKSVSDSKYQPKGSYLTSIPDEYITETELNEKNYATKSDLEDLDVNIDLSDYYNKGEIDKKLEEISSGDIDLSDYATTAALTAGLNSKQDILVSGTSVKTVNNISLLGSGNIEIGGGSGDVTVIPGPGFQYIFLLTQDPRVTDDMNPARLDAVQNDNYKPEGWSTYPQTVNETWEYQWVSTRRKIDGVWEKFTEPVLYNNYVTDGITPDVSFTSFVFCRTNDNFTSSDTLPTGGTYKLPKPSNPGTIGGKTVTWTDTVPSGTAKIWMSSYTFKNTENYEGEGTLVKPTWSTPRQMSDTANFQVEFSTKVKPVPPESLQRYYDGDSINYEENWRKNNSDWTDEGTGAIWMATSTMSNGIWSDWQVFKIKGEDGADGTSVKILGTLESTDKLPQPHDGKVGDGYIINGNCYIWDGDTWENAGRLQGPAGEPGATPFLHIKYATLLYDPKDSSQFDEKGNWLGWTQVEDEVPGETPGDYIGLYVEYAIVKNPDDVPDDKLDPDLYTWSKWNGEDGWFYEYIYTTTKTYNAPEIPTAKSNSSGKTNQDDEFVPDGWYDDPVDVSETNPYCWQCYRRKVSGVWGPFKGSASNPGYAAIWNNWAEKGEKGETGEDGAGIEYIYAHSKIDTETFSASELKSPDRNWDYDNPDNSTGWFDNPQGVSPDYPIEWVAKRAKPEGTSSWIGIEWSSPKVWSRFSADGKDGPGLEYVFLLSTSEALSDGINYITTLAANQTPDYTPKYDYDAIHYEWVDNNSQVTAELPYLWSSIRRKKDGVWQQFEEPVLWNRFTTNGKNGTSIKIVGSYESIDAFEAKFRPNGEWIAPDNESDAYIVAGDLYVWNGEAWVDVGRINGNDGQSMYIHVKYSEYSTGFNFSDVPNKYIGIKINNNSTPPTEANEYTWTKFVGDDGWGYEYQYHKSVTEATETTLKDWGNPSTKPAEWSKDYPGVSATEPYVYITYSKTTTPREWSAPSLFAHYGKGEVGPTGRMLYPAGVWNADKEYILGDNTAPYVWYNETYWYLINDKSKGNNPAEANSLYWKPMEKYSAIYSDIGVFAQALVGQAVFYKDFMFSQDGEKTGTDVSYANFNFEDPYKSDNVFKPNLCFNLKTGQAWLSTGKVMFDKDGSGHLANGQISWDKDGNLYLPSMATISAAFNDEGLNINVQQVYSSSGKTEETLRVDGKRQSETTATLISDTKSDNGLSKTIPYNNAMDLDYLISLTLYKNGNEVQTIAVPFGALKLNSDLYSLNNTSIADTPYLSHLLVGEGNGDILTMYNKPGNYQYYGFPKGSITLSNKRSNDVTLQIYGTNVILNNDTVTLTANGTARINFEITDPLKASITVQNATVLT